MRIGELEDTIQNDPELLFFKTILSDNGDNAFQIYERLFKQSSSPLKNLSAQKLSEYYFARGFYVKSSEYKKIAKTYIPIKTSEDIKSGDNSKKNTREKIGTSIYKIQVGAFGVRENADDLVSFLKGKNLDANIVDRIVDGTRLYCVWVEGAANLESTERIAEDIKMKYRLSYRIVEP
jgi:hypothetical protein